MLDGEGLSCPDAARPREGTACWRDWATHWACSSLKLSTTSLKLLPKHDLAVLSGPMISLIAGSRRGITWNRPVLQQLWQTVSIPLKAPRYAGKVKYLLRVALDGSGKKLPLFPSRSPPQATVDHATHGMHGHRAIQRGTHAPYPYLTPSCRYKQCSLIAY